MAAEQNKRAEQELIDLMKQDQVSLEATRAAISEVKAKGGNIDARELERHTPLMLAAKRGDTNAVTAFLEAGANPLLKNASNQKASELVSQFADIKEQEFLVVTLKAAERSAKLEGKTEEPDSPIITRGTIARPMRMGKTKEEDHGESVAKEAAGRSARSRRAMRQAEGEDEGAVVEPESMEHAYTPAISRVLPKDSEKTQLPTDRQERPKASQEEARQEPTMGIPYLEETYRLAREYKGTFKGDKEGTDRGYRFLIESAVTSMYSHTESPFKGYEHKDFSDVAKAIMDDGAFKKEIDKKLVATRKGAHNKRNYLVVAASIAVAVTVGLCFKYFGAASPEVIKETVSLPKLVNALGSGVCKAICSLAAGGMTAMFAGARRYSAEKDADNALKEAVSGIAEKISKEFEKKGIVR